MIQSFTPPTSDSSLWKSARESARLQLAVESGVRGQERNRVLDTCERIAREAMASTPGLTAPRAFMCALRSWRKGLR